ncbi:unnamed protein product [Paramecium octaurelia]|uniref:Uncharacterized protein n=1 Tax=Paramecium octaurelia TaxID=43137 RepID=A0A8S1WQV3_PAROT|nr:unnamed protein product [Paramecium octaurelia]
MISNQNNQQISQYTFNGIMIGFFVQYQITMKIQLCQEILNKQQNLDEKERMVVLVKTKNLSDYDMVQILINNKTELYHVVLMKNIYFRTIRREQRLDCNIKDYGRTRQINSLQRQDILIQNVDQINCLFQQSQNASY